MTAIIILNVVLAVIVIAAILSLLIGGILADRGARPVRAASARQAPGPVYVSSRPARSAT
ncbi:MAG TPA: hypothetical protein VMU39_27700 [Solirubrobacteraceae bacterium]|nr:hypothetical protein [Solirubrobacteraceae bacterium]